MRVSIVGGGIVGCCIAWQLALRGVAVTVLERAVPGAEASRVAAGILGPGAETSPREDEADAHAFALGARSRDLHAAWSDRLAGEIGVDVGFRRCGVLEVAFDVATAERLAAKARFLAARGARIVSLTGDEARSAEPALTGEVVAALEHVDDAQVEPPTFLRAVAIAAERAGVRFVSGATVRGLHVESGVVRGVDADGARIEADAVVIAAGAWTSLVPGVPRGASAVHPVRGQILSTESRPPLFRRIVFGDGAYVVTRPDGRVLVGATSEHVGFAREVTLGGIAELSTKACRIAPRIASAPLLGHAVSFRPGSPDHLPIVGREGPRGLVIASGHHRNGVLLAPLTAELVAELLVDGRADPALSPMRPDRFTEDVP